MGVLLEQLLVAFGPTVLDLIKEWQKRNNTTELPPSIEALKDDLHAYVQSQLTEGSNWRKANPNA